MYCDWSDVIDEHDMVCVMLVQALLTILNDFKKNEIWNPVCDTQLI